MTPQIIESEDGLLWSVSPGTDDRLGPEFHEQPLLPIIRHLTPRGRAFVDIGAHVGTWALRMAMLGHDVRAVEANPLTFKTLATNIGLNSLSHKIKGYGYAAWSHWGLAELWDDNNKSSGGSTRCQHLGAKNRRGSKIAEIQTIPAHLLLEGVWGCTIKIDVEGAESKILEGLCLDEGLRPKPNLFIELHGDILGDPLHDDQVIEQVRDLGYHVPDTAADLPRYGRSRYLAARPR